MVKASASQLADLGFIFRSSHTKKLKNGIHSFLLGAQQNRNSVENKPASLLVVSLSKTLNEIRLSICGRQVVGPSSLPVVVAPVLLKTRKPSVSANAVYTFCCIMLTTNSSNHEEANFTCLHSSTQRKI